MSGKTDQSQTTTPKARCERAGASDVLLALLREFRLPTRPRDIRALAAERGLQFSEGAWQAAKRELGVQSFQWGGLWYWTLPGLGVEDELAQWLETPHGRFAVYVTERDRLGPPEPGQLELALDDVNGAAA